MIADAVIEVLAAVGARGLTHRAVDAAAGLPPGSCSYYFRSREALLIAAAHRIAELDVGGTDTPVTAPDSVAALVRLLVSLVHAQTASQRERTEARYHLTLEARHYPPVQAVLEELATGFLDAATAMLAAVGARRPRSDARAVIAVCAGIVFESTVGGQRPYTRPEIRALLTDVLTARLRNSPAPRSRGPSR